MAWKAIENNAVIVCEWSRKEDGPSGRSQGSEAAVVMSCSAGSYFAGKDETVHIVQAIDYPYS